MRSTSGSPNRAVRAVSARPMARERCDLEAWFDRIVRDRQLSSGMILPVAARVLERPVDGLSPIKSRRPRIPHVASSLRVRRFVLTRTEHDLPKHGKPEEVDARPESLRHRPSGD